MVLAWVMAGLSTKQLPSRKCTYDGCTSLVSSGLSTCDVHAKVLMKRDSAYRGSRDDRGYGHTWRKMRADQLRQHPLCVSCMTDGQIVAATQVDHITPHRGDRSLFRDPANMQSLCASCHSHKTATEDGGFGYARA